MKVVMCMLACFLFLFENRMSYLVWFVVDMSDSGMLWCNPALERCRTVKKTLFWLSSFKPNIFLFLKMCTETATRWSKPVCLVGLSDIITFVIEKPDMKADIIRVGGSATDGHTIFEGYYIYHLYPSGKHRI